MASDAQLRAAMWRSMGDAFAACSARTADMPGLVALATPAAPDRSVFNSVIPERGPELAQRLADAYDDLATLYAQAGVRAWTVWLESGDEEAAALLAARGHVLDAQPAAMGAPLEEIAHVPLADGHTLELTDATGGDIRTVAALNGRAYGHEDDFVAGMSELRTGRLGIVRDADGEAVSCAWVVTVAQDAAVEFVATAEQARGRGLAGAVMSALLRDAAGAGARTTTLQATRMGRGVYERMGYRVLGDLAMWERRES